MTRDQFKVANTLLEDIEQMKYLKFIFDKWHDLGLYVEGKTNITNSPVKKVDSINPVLTKEISDVIQKHIDKRQDEFDKFLTGRD